MRNLQSIWLGMNRSGKILLALTVLTLAPGLFVELDVVEVSTVPGLYALLPAGVIFLAMFVLDLALGKRLPGSMQKNGGAIISRRRLMTNPLNIRLGITLRRPNHRPMALF